MLIKLSMIDEMLYEVEYGDVALKIWRLLKIMHNIPKKGREFLLKIMLFSMKVE
jgi:hypothetical protein